MYFKKETQPGFGMLLLSRRDQAPLFVLHSFAHLSCDDHAMHFIILLYTTPDNWTYLYRFIYVPPPSLSAVAESTLSNRYYIFIYYTARPSRSIVVAAIPTTAGQFFFLFNEDNNFPGVYNYTLYRYTFLLHLWCTRHTGHTKWLIFFGNITTYTI